MVEEMIFYLLLIDSIGANIAAWFHLGNTWYYKNFRTFPRFFPLSRGWTTYYLILVLWAGSLLMRADMLSFSF